MALLTMGLPKLRMYLLATDLLLRQAGTASGTPSHRVCVEDCGQLASPTDADDAGARRTERLSGTVV